MDFMKTSSLRALSELTFQRNWNGLIWMSRKGVTTKRVKTVQVVLSKNRGQAVHSGRPRNECFAIGQIKSIRLKSRPKFKHIRPSTHHDPGSNVPRSAKPRPLNAMPREPGSNALRLRDLSHVPRPMAPSEPGSHVPCPAEKTSANPSPVRPQRPTTNPSGYDRSDCTKSGHDPIIRPIVPTYRPISMFALSLISMFS
ncbi:unnamed protein product [Microthlaspi erraticum]|uniref:Uncharacterized protein n=1 Tax=Microthlaspi erraticum TaxID=1685480 RepID=A0A6D2JF60_9BRAS|nr:unnamed protein product [Microthlaspi erraticum]